MSVEQRKTALARAQEVRLERARLRAEINAPATYAEGAAAFAGIIEDGVPKALAGMHLESVLKWIKRSLPLTRDRVLAYTDTRPTTEMGALTGRQLGELVRALRSSTADLARELDLRAWQRRVAA